MPTDTLIDAAKGVLKRADEKKLLLATAESCTGGLIAASITAIPGSSSAFERGFVTYSNEAKAEMLGVPPELIKTYGAVSADVARAMAEGAIAHSRADASIGVTGVAGPDGGTPDKPVGLVHLAASRRNGHTLHEMHSFGDIGRRAVQEETARVAFALLLRVLD